VARNNRSPPFARYVALALYVAFPLLPHHAETPADQGSAARLPASRLAITRMARTLQYSL